jgi:CubicO group peptidase (beta-lactamase class C family)
LVTGDGYDFTCAAGFADRANRIPNTAETRFGIASGTKLITALGIGVLMDQGVLAEQTPVHELVTDELPGISRDVQ